MLNALENDYGHVILGIQQYNSCLSKNQTLPIRNTLGEITPEKPSWLNDYYVATALESLSEDCRIVKAKKFNLQSWPPTAELYLFAKRIEGISCDQQVDQLEADSKCLAHQFWNECLYAPRYVAKEQAETTEPGTTKIGTAYWLKDDAAPCSRCWDIKSRQSDIRSLVESITKYDLSAAATIEITGQNQEFQEATISAIIESDCTAEAATVRGIVKKAIEIRSAQICHLQPEGKTEWDNQLTSEFRSRLDSYIEAESERASPMTSSSSP